MKRPFFGNTLYPSQEELNWLANTESYEELNTRLEDANFENLMADIKVRRSQQKEITDRFPFGVSRMIALYMDIRDVLTMSWKSTLFTLFVIDDLFWKTRLDADFPLLSKWDPTHIKGTCRYKSQPWRRYYNFVHYIFHRCVYSRIPSVLQSMIRVSYSNIQFHTHWNREKGVYICRTLRMTNNAQIGEAKELKFEEMLKKCNLTMYQALVHLMVIYSSQTIFVRFLLEPNRKDPFDLTPYDGRIAYPEEILAKGHIYSSDTKIYLF